MNVLSRASCNGLLLLLLLLSLCNPVTDVEKLQEEIVFLFTDSLHLTIGLSLRTPIEELGEGLKELKGIATP